MDFVFQGGQAAGQDGGGQPFTQSTQEPRLIFMSKASSKDLTRGMDASGRSRLWMCKHLCEGSFNHFLHAADIKQAHDFDMSGYEFDEDQTPLLCNIDVAELFALLVTIFPNISVNSSDNGTSTVKAPLIKGLRWKMLEGCLISHALSLDICIANNVPIRKDARAVSHLSPEERLRTWFHLYFEVDPQASLGMVGLWGLFEWAFQPFQSKTAPIQEEQFVKCLFKTFPGATMTSVTTHYAVIRGLGVKSKPIKADQALQMQARKKVESLMNKGVITPPKTEFARKLLDDPLFSHWLDEGGTEPDPIAERLRRQRSRVPRKPVSDEEEAPTEEDEDEHEVAPAYTVPNAATEIQASRWRPEPRPPPPVYESSLSELPASKRRR